MSARMERPDRPRPDEPDRRPSAAQIDAAARAVLADRERRLMAAGREQAARAREVRAS